MRVILSTFLALLAASAMSSGAAPHTMRLVESVVLPDYGGNWYTAPTSINNRNEIAGWAAQGNERVAFVRTRRGHYELIADRATPLDINDRGDVVGIRDPCHGDYCWLEGFVWSRERGLHNLGSFLPFAVNDRGDMAGVCNPPSQPCLMRGGVVSVIVQEGGQARGINAGGAVVGLYGDNRAFHLTPDWQFNDIGRGVASDINHRGVIAGHRWLAVGGPGERAVVTAWTKSGPRTPALEVSTGVAINKKGWVIVNAFDAQQKSYSFIWDPATNARVMLESATGESVQLEDLNDRGDVVGQAGMRAVIWQVRDGDMFAPHRPEN